MLYIHMYISELGIETTTHFSYQNSSHDQLFPYQNVIYFQYLHGQMIFSMASFSTININFVHNHIKMNTSEAMPLTST